MSANPVVSVRRGTRGARVAAFAVVLAASAAAGAGVTRADAAPDANPALQVSVTPDQPLATVPETGIGINGSTYDGSLLDKPVPGLLRSAGIRLVRIPGGTESDQYDWKANTDVLSGSKEAVRFDQFMSVIRQAGAQAMVTVDYGTGNTIGQRDGTGETGAQIAADWVRYANVTHHYNVKYWEIGNEVYGNGTFGANWEPDAHCQTAAGTPVTLGQEPSQTFNCGPAAYAANAKQYIAAMKAVDPDISVGVVLTASGAPNNWPDGVTNAQSPQSWNQTVLSAVGGDIGFADVHWYPQNPSNVTPPGPTDAGLLADTQQIAPGLAPLRTELAQFAGRAGIPIMVTETNSVSSNPGKQILSVVNALYLEQDYLTWLENGALNVDWWQIHNGIVTSGDNGSSLFGNATYGDYGVLSDGTCGTTPAGAKVCEPPADTPFASYYGLQVLSRFIHPGDALVKASSSQSLVQTYAARARGGRLRVMVVNDDPASGYDVTLSVPGYKLAAGTPVIFYGPASSQVQYLTGPAAAAAAHTAAPYSVTVYTLVRD
ncbi:MAG: hypothetical protein JO345_16435 [Streptosporangiaceae bacterium]|nr:hypothetical protein [Streptosporangiaceae bacterium]